jgi:sarcosine oxidase, subunit beta
VSGAEETGSVPRTADVVIVGGGIIGLSVAYHLGRSGVRAVVLERGRIGEGSTARSSGGIRRMFSTEPAIRLSLESARFWERAEDELGRGVDWLRIGYLLIARSPRQRALLDASWALQQRLGVPSSLLTAGEVCRLVPAMRTDDVLAGTYCPTDGYAGPYEALQAFRAAALRLRTAIIEGCEVTGLRLRGDRVQGLETRAGKLDAPVVVNAAGVWAPQLAASVGVGIPTVMYRRHQWIIQTPEDHVPVPCIIDMDSALFVRPEGRKYLLGIGGERPTATFDLTVDSDAFEPVAALAIERFPVFRSAGLVRAYVGLTQETPDRHPVLGPAGPSGFVLAAGFSHGFMHAPAAGRMIAEYITTGQTGTIPIEPFLLSRFGGRETVAAPSAAAAWEAH